MTEFCTRRARADKADAPSSSPTKTPRERRITLHIEANSCEHVFARVLRLAAASGLIPVDMFLEKGRKIFTIDLQIDRADFMPTAGFLGQIEGVSAVRSADILDHCGHSLFPVKVGEDGGLIAPDSLAPADRQNERGKGRGGVRGLDFGMAR